MGASYPGDRQGVEVSCRDAQGVGVHAYGDLVEKKRTNKIQIIHTKKCGLFSFSIYSFIYSFIHLLFFSFNLFIQLHENSFF